MSKKAAQFLISQDKSTYLPVGWYIFAKKLSKVANDLTIYQVEPSLAGQYKNSYGMIASEESMSFDSDIEINHSTESAKKNQDLKIQVKNLIAPIFGFHRNNFKD